MLEQLDDQLYAQQIGYTPMLTNGYIPSNDFGLFRLPQFGELFGDSIGVATSYNSNYPTDYVNYSVNSLASILQPRQPLSMPSLPNYGQGIELPNFINLAPLIEPNYFQGNQKPYQEPSKIFLPMYPLPGSPTGSVRDLPPTNFPTRSDAEIARDPYGNKTTVNVYPQDKESKNIFGGRIPIWSSDYPMVSDGKGSGDKRVIGDDPTKSGDKAQSVVDLFKSLPAGSGVFLIAVAVIVLILLFARK